ncbi:MAG: hypothetical protein SO016_03515 [Lachnospiraceae bacterium]|nr:hypothetical protein [Robinsoniella sp.]MDY3765754.1 hypothetical protein [Lachnospiraceae bacterium]
MKGWITQLFGHSIDIETTPPLGTCIKKIISILERFLLVVFVMGIVFCWPYFIEMAQESQGYHDFLIQLLKAGAIANGVVILAMLLFFGYRSFASAFFIFFCVDLIAFLFALYHLEEPLVAVGSQIGMGRIVEFYFNMLVAVMVSPIPAFLSSILMEGISRIVNRFDPYAGK